MYCFGDFRLANKMLNYKINNSRNQAEFDKLRGDQRSLLNEKGDAVYRAVQETKRLFC